MHLNANNSEVQKIICTKIQPAKKSHIHITLTIFREFFFFGSFCCCFFGFFIFCWCFCFFGWGENSCTYITKHIRWDKEKPSWYFQQPYSIYLATREASAQFLNFIVGWLISQRIIYFKFLGEYWVWTYPSKLQQCLIICFSKQ